MTILKTTGAITMTAMILLTLLTAFGTPALAQGGPQRNNQGGPQRNNQECCLAGPVAPLSAEEAKWLVFMREEEKLARDVYQQMYAKWNLRIFSNIARSEQRHFESLGTLMERYGVEDPAGSTSPGVYADAKLTVLYNQLMAKGGTSLKDALEVGVLIEKADIEDLQDALESTDKADVKRVYTNLLDGSLNHQEAFEDTLEAVSAQP